jgi:chromate transporter
MVMAIAWAYRRFGGLSWMQGAFYGIAAAVVAVIGRSASKLTRLTLGTSRLLWALFGVVALVTAWTESEIVWVFIGAGAVAVLARSRPFSAVSRTALGVGVLPAGVLAAVAGPEASWGTLWRIGWYFAEAGAFVFGSGLAIVPFLHAGVVQEFRWLDERQFLDAVAVAMITPGPVVITVAFIGYLVAGSAGAVVAALATFFPCYLFTVIPAPHFQRLSRNVTIRAFVEGVTAAATGAIAGAVVVLGRRALVDLTTVSIALASLLVLTRWKRIPEPALIGAAGLLGILAVRAPGIGAEPTPRVVFVCAHGSAKSLVAASLFDRLAKERGLAFRALSRGTAPDSSVPAPVVESLRSDGFDVSGFRPQPLTKEDMAGAVRVIAIGVDVGDLARESPVEIERWDDIPPVSTRYRDARQALLDRMAVVLAELGGSASGPRRAR